MDPAANALFEYTRARVTDEDICNFSPNDPGHPDYVKLWQAMRRSGVVPEGAPFDLTEVISLTGFADAETQRDPDRFRRYRRFSSAVSVVLVHRGYEGDVAQTPNYLARDLVMDVNPKGRGHLSLIRPVLQRTRMVLRDSFCGGRLTISAAEFPFFTLADMILAQKARDWQGSERAATRLIEDETTVRSGNPLNADVQDDRFLLGLTRLDQRHQDWLRFMLELQNPTGHADTQLVIDSAGSW